MHSNRSKIPVPDGCCPFSPFMRRALSGFLFVTISILLQISERLKQGSVNSCIFVIGGALEYRY